MIFDAVLAPNVNFRKLAGPFRWLVADFRDARWYDEPLPFSATYEIRVGPFQLVRLRLALSLQ